jgi:hypothetical protein
MLSEHEIAELLRANQRDHPLADGERERIRAVLFAADARSESVDVAIDDGVADVAVTPETGQQRPRRTGLLLAAAALLVVVGVWTALLGSEDQSLTTVAGPTGTETPVAGDLLPAPTPEPTVDPRSLDLGEGRELCAGPFAAFSRGIAAWDGIENWSYLTDPRDPEPHLPALAIDLIDGLDTILGETSLTPARTEIEAAIEESEQFEGFTPEIRIRMVDALTAVVADSRDAIEADVDAGFLRLSTCDLSTFRAKG